MPVFCFLFTFAGQVDGMMPLALPGAALLDLGFSRYPPRACGGDADGERRCSWGQRGRDTVCRRGMLRARRGRRMKHLSAGAGKAGPQQEPAILTSLLMKNTSAVRLPRGPRRRRALRFSAGCCRTFYFTIVETKLESIFNIFSLFPLCGLPLSPRCCADPAKARLGFGGG